MSTSTPLKLRGTNGDLQQVNSTEENYLAYLAGLQLGASIGSDPGDLTLVIDGHNVVGTFVDTYFNEAVGTHPATSITSGSTSTTLYQRNGTASESGADFRRPVAYDETNQRIVEMDDTQFNALVDRLNSRIAQSDYPGIFKLGSSSPGADYTVYSTNIFSDTDTDGTVTSYNLYRRTTMSAPSSVKIMALKRSSGATGDYQGIQEMTATQMQYSLGQRAKTRKGVADNIGSYKLRSSSQGAPSPGTWRSVGTATNTKKTTAEIDYTRTSTREFLRTSVVAFTRDSTRTSARTFVGDYTGDFTREFSGDYTREFLGDYVANFLGEYARDRQTNFARERAATFTADFVGNYARERVSSYARERSATFLANYLGEYARERNVSYTREFAGNYAREFAGEFIGNYARERAASYAREFTGNYAREFVGNYSRNRTQSYARERAANFVGNVNYVGDVNYVGNANYFREINYLRERSQTFVGNYLGGAAYTPYYYQLTAPAYYANYWDTSGVSPQYPFRIYWAGTQVYGPITYGSVPASGQTFVVGSYVYQISFVGSSTSATKGSSYTIYWYSVRRRLNSETAYARERSVTYVGDYVGDQSRNLTANYIKETTYTSDINYTANYVGNYTADFVGNYSRTRAVAYTRTRVAFRNATFVGNYSRLRTRTSAVSYIRERAVAYTRTFVGDITKDRTANTPSTFVGNYNRTFVGDYSRNRTVATSSTFVGDYTGNFIGDYQRDRLVNTQDQRNENYIRERAENRESTFARERSSTYTGNFTGDYTRDFIGNYVAEFLGNYIGTTIQSSRETIETYTLYVRTA